MATYLSRYYANFSEITAPLQELLHHENAFIWSDRQVEAFDGLHNMLSSAPVLQYYDIKKPVTLQCDASQHGIGCVLLQDGKPVEYTSRAMAETEQQYTQIENELLAIVHGFEKFHSYVYGRGDVMVVSDHKPLLAIHKKALVSAPKRLQRTLLRRKRYTYNLTYQPGS